MAPHSSPLAWKIPWMEEPGRLQSMGSLGVQHDWATSLSLFTFMHWRRKWQPTPVFLPGESQGPGEPGGRPSVGSHRVGHDWSNLAAAAAAVCILVSPLGFNLHFPDKERERGFFIFKDQLYIHFVKPVQICCIFLFWVISWYQFEGFLYIYWM